MRALLFLMPYFIHNENVFPGGLRLDFRNVLEFHLNVGREILLNEMPQFGFGLARVAWPAYNPETDAVLGPINDLKSFHIAALPPPLKRDAPEIRFNQTAILGFKYLSRAPHNFSQQHLRPVSYTHLTL